MTDVTKHIDLDHLEKYVTGDIALRDEILSIFIDQVTLLLEQFDVNSDDDAWENTAHSLKGAARGVGAFELGNLGEEAEKYIKKYPEKNAARAEVLSSIKKLSESVVAEVLLLRK